MKKLVVYYSFEGNTEFIGKTIAGEIEADLLQLQPEKEMGSKGFMKYLWGGKQAIMKERPKLQPLNYNPEEYDLIVIGTPVWAWTYAPPLRTFFSMVKLSRKSIALFSCNGGQNGKTFQRMEEALKGNDIIGEMEFCEPLRSDKGESKKKAKQWAKEITGIIQ